MPDKRRYRGTHPEDLDLFAPDMLLPLNEAVSDLSWLFGRGYANNAALKLVGDRYQLRERQRMAVLRCACSDDARDRRNAKQVNDLKGRHILLDGFNVLLTIEAAMSGGVVLRSRDGCYRDVASVHGNYRKVEETLPAIEAIGEALEQTEASEATWYLDSPVSNSGRLRASLLDVAEQRGWNWQVELVSDPDRILKESAETVASADSVVLDHCGTWNNLARRVVDHHVDSAWIIELSGVLPVTTT